MRRLAVLLCLLPTAVVVAAGCGGTETAGRASASPETVVRAWAAAMREGDVDAATDLFAVPALVQNGTPEIRLESRKQVFFFNRTLPCGGRVVATKRHHGFIIATFRLTDRPGGACGSGTGGTAKAAFMVRRGRIVRWIRVPEGDEPSAPTGPLV